MTQTPLQVGPLPLQATENCDERAVPLGYQCLTERVAAADTHAWICERRSELKDQLNTFGVILFRGFGLQTPEDFDSFVGAFGDENFPYDESLSNAVRVVRTDRVFSANEAPPEVTIYLHHEMAQTPISPRKLYFFCEKAAVEGGATPVCRSDLLLNRLAEKVPQFVSDCESKGLKYTNVMPGQDDATSGMGRSWRSTLRADDRSKAEAKLNRLGYTWKWLEDDCLRATTPVLPAVREIGPGRRSFFNQLIAASKGWKDSRNDPSKALTHGDGQPLDQDAVYLATELAAEFTYNVQWQVGDVAMVDNRISMHARQPFQGTRKIWASLAGAQHHSTAK